MKRKYYRSPKSDHSHTSRNSVAEGEGLKITYTTIKVNVAYLKKIMF